ncbi:hypothetical protein LGN32_39215, partial [Burkholderia contaminans]|uniref:hypothetical protein n=1 Tax=Burkholderia contaminans TaxID=488447 RepID=UPI001CF2EE66
PNTNFGIPRNCSTSSETAVHLPPETLFDFNRNPCSASPKYAPETRLRNIVTMFVYGRSFLLRHEPDATAAC